jgi:hypothetical protein
MSYGQKHREKYTKPVSLSDLEDQTIDFNFSGNPNISIEFGATDYPAFKQTIVARDAENELYFGDAISSLQKWCQDVQSFAHEVVKHPDSTKNPSQVIRETSGYLQDTLNETFDQAVSPLFGALTQSQGREITAIPREDYTDLYICFQQLEDDIGNITYTQEFTPTEMTMEFDYAHQNNNLPVTNVDNTHSDIVSYLQDIIFSAESFINRLKSRSNNIYVAKKSLNTPEEILVKHLYAYQSRDQYLIDQHAWFFKHPETSQWCRVLAVTMDSADYTDKWAIQLQLSPTDIEWVAPVDGNEIVSWRIPSKSINNYKYRIGQRVQSNSDKRIGTVVGMWRDNGSPKYRIRYEDDVMASEQPYGSFRRR